MAIRPSKASQQQMEKISAYNMLGFTGEDLEEYNKLPKEAKKSVGSVSNYSKVKREYAKIPDAPNKLSLEQFAGLPPASRTQHASDIDRVVKEIDAARREEDRKRAEEDHRKAVEAEAARQREEQVTFRGENPEERFRDVLRKTSVFDPDAGTGLKLRDELKLDTSKYGLTTSMNLLSDDVTSKLMDPSQITSGMDLKAVSEAAAGRILDSKDLGQARTGIETLRGIGETEGDTRFAGRLLESQKAEEGFALDDVTAAQQQARQSAFESLAQMGGLESGARERIAQAGSEAALRGRQGVRQQGILSRGQIRSEDEARKLGLLKDQPALLMNLAAQERAGEQTAYGLQSDAARDILAEKQIQAGAGLQQAQFLTGAKQSQYQADLLKEQYNKGLEQAEAERQRNLLLGGLGQRGQFGSAGIAQDVATDELDKMLRAAGLLPGGESQAPAPAPTKEEEIKRVKQEMVKLSQQPFWMRLGKDISRGLSSIFD